MRVGVLGPVVLWDANGAEVPLAPQLRRLLGLLVAADGAPVAPDRIASHVTDGNSEGSVLRTAVSRLRRTLGSRVQTSSSGYRLVVAPDELDAAEFIRLVRFGHDVEPLARVAVLERALALWRGDAFEGVADESWAVEAARRLDDERSTAAEDLAEALVASDRVHEAIPLLRSLVERHPHRERPVAILMHSLAAIGRRTEGLDAYQRLRVSLRDDMGLEPSMALRQLESELLDGISASLPLAIAPQRPSRTIPAPVESFVGRTLELKQLVDSLPSRRLVSLVGPGGVGKTRLALQMATVAESDFAAGVWVVELVSVTDRDAVMHHAASVFGAVPDGSVDVLEAVVEVVRGRQALVVIDNAEHVREAAAELATAIAASGDDVRVIVTSRQRLGVRGEHVHVVDPLDEFESVDLFCERAREADDSIEFDDEERVVVGTICARLDGLPLAIEIAAARTRSATTHDLLEQLDEGMHRRSAARITGDRHVTMHAAIDWSYRLLAQPERDVLTCASVFAGGFDLAAITAVAADAVPAGTTLDDVVAALVDRSMVVADRRGRSVRYRLFETVRQFCAEQLDVSGGSDEVHRRHVSHFVAVARQVTQLRATDARAAAELLEREWDNLRAALFWAVEHGDVDSATGIALGVTMSLSLCRDEHRRWLVAALGIAPPGYRWTPLLLCFIGWWSNLLGDHPEALRRARAGLALADPASTRDRRLLNTVVAEALVHLGEPEAALAASDEVIALCTSEDVACDGLMLACWSAWGCRPELVAGYAERLGRIARTSGHRESLHQAAYTAGIVALIDGEPQTAVAYFREALGWASGMRGLELEAWQGLTMAAAATDDADTLPIFRHALELLAAERTWAHLWMVIEALAIHLADAGRLDEAAVLLGALDVHGRASVFLVPGRARARAAVAAVPSVGPSTARGRSMERSRVVEAAIVCVSA